MKTPAFSQNLISSIHDGMFFVDTNRTITFWNKAAEAITGFTADEVIGSHCYDYLRTHIDSSGTSLCSGLCPLAETMKDREIREADVFLLHKAGQRVPASIRVIPICDDDGNVIGGAEIFSDLSNKNAIDLRTHKLEQYGHIDEQTKLANRNYITKEIKSRISESNNHNISFGVIVIDIDNFKQVNTNHGQELGDRVLRMTANTIINSSQSFDIYGRWDRDQFIGIIKNTNKSHLKDVAEQQRMLIENSYIILDASTKLSVTVSSVGTVALPDDTFESILSRLDNSLSNMKSSGKCNTIFITD